MTNWNLRGLSRSLLLLLAVQSGCRHAGPHARSAADRERYAQLSAAERTAVDAGLLRPGMSPGSVRLAWGKPSQIRETIAEGRPRLEWSYYGTQWVDRPAWKPTLVDRFGRHWLEYGADRVGITILLGRAVFVDEQLIDWQPRSGRP